MIPEGYKVRDKVRGHYVVTCSVYSTKNDFFWIHFNGLPVKTISFCILILLLLGWVYCLKKKVNPTTTIECKHFTSRNRIGNGIGDIVSLFVLYKDFQLLVTNCQLKTGININTTVNQNNISEFDLNTSKFPLILTKVQELSTP